MQFVEIAVQNTDNNIMQVAIVNAVLLVDYS